MPKKPAKKAQDPQVAGKCELCGGSAAGEVWDGQTSWKVCSARLDLPDRPRKKCGEQ